MPALGTSSSDINGLKELNFISYFIEQAFEKEGRKGRVKITFVISIPYRFILAEHKPCDSAIWWMYLTGCSEHRERKCLELHKSKESTWNVYGIKINNNNKDLLQDPFNPQKLKFLTCPCFHISLFLFSFNTWIHEMASVHMWSHQTSFILDLTNFLLAIVMSEIACLYHLLHIIMTSQLIN